MVELNWAPPDKDATYDQTLIYKASSAYGTYSLLATLTDIRVIQYIDPVGSTASWYKIRFYDSVNTVYSAYSAPTPGSATVSDTNYTSPLLVAKFLGNFQAIVAEALGTGTGAQLAFGPVTLPKMIANTETVYVSGTAKKRNTDYTVNYDTGVVTFAAAPANLAALTIDYWGNTVVYNSQIIAAIKRSEDIIDRTVGRGFYQPQTVIESVDSYDPIDTSPFAFMPLDYMSDTRSYQRQTSTYLYSRVLRLANYPITAVNQILTNAQVFIITGEAVGTGTGAATVFTLLNAPVVYGSEIAYLNGVQTTAYTINYTTGAITFSPAPSGGVVITCDYNHCAGANVLTTTDYRINAGAGLIYLNTTAAAVNEQLAIVTVSYTYGYAAVPPVVEDIATKLAAISVAESMILGSPTPQSINASNISAMKQEVAEGFTALGRKLELVRI